MGTITRPLAALARHLGPWAPASGLPAGHRRDEVTIEGPGESFRAWRFWPKGDILGSYLVAPGLHPDGPSDPRLERFCASLAAAGFLTMAPFLPTACRLQVSEQAVDDLDASFDALVSETAPRGLRGPALFSISFGVLAAAGVAARRGREPSALVMFGGYADFGRTVRFATCGEVPGQDGPWVPSDPLNRPAVFINIVPYLETAHRDALAAAWMAMVRRTWGRFELKRPGSRWPMARELAATLPEEARELFLIGCGLRPGGVRLVEEGLARAAGTFAFTDPRPALGRVQVPSVIVHGRSDDVIPCTEAAELARALPPEVSRGALLTGFYGHTGSERPGAREVAAEVATLGRVLGALAAAPLGVL